MQQIGDGPAVRSAALPSAPSPALPRTAPHSRWACWLLGGRRAACEAAAALRRCGSRAEPNVADQPQPLLRSEVQARWRSVVAAQTAVPPKWTAYQCPSWSQSTPCPHQSTSESKVIDSTQDSSTSCQHRHSTSPYKVCNCTTGTEQQGTATEHFLEVVIVVVIVVVWIVTRASGNLLGGHVALEAA
eukprot:COSAG01_NODE_1944_length_8831_cov_18.803023_6_plen_187_part_00